ncbi:pentatricopeptide repeat-containing protein At3g46790, chloroplastic-like [Arachis duranensis]|uniref:Pentatricopeptide repeat-containing protein At3g46790, chloroplastic-like n=1 Tax=Arachis duranensis TaxID=130453 RepID=A0A6P4CHQ6_ARADU|nr:pentatricopeptide repeat-containing protein At3g46790, chloroplastic-like [Arachis duranensis]XP_052112170.1 pentatricopeptide repeat-containing protein At3g46790, chloroplastic-like [Arachis duranensis]
MHGVSRRVQQFLVPKPHKKESFYYTDLLNLCKTTNCIKQTHAQIVVNGHEQNPFVTTKLVDRYTQLNSNLEYARKVFDTLSERDVFCWNVLIKGYANMGPFVEAIKVYDEMHTSGTTPNRYTYPFALKACAAERDFHKGRVIHGHVVKCGLDLDLFVANGLIAFYAKCQEVEVSRRVFDKMPQRDIVSWNSMISGYATNGYVDDAILLFYDMLRDGDISAPDNATFVTILPAFAQAADVQAGYWIHSYIVKIGMNLDAAIASGLISLYSNCGYIRMARAIFDQVSDRNVIVWNAIIRCYGMHGLAEEALSMFQQLVESSVKPDGVLFLCLLSACSHAGLLKQGWHLFLSMETYGVKKSEAHYACIVDLLGRAGDLNKALEIIQTMPIQPGKNVYGALLGASRIHKNMELAEFAAEKLLVLDPNNAGRYVILAQMYEDAGRWEDAARVRKIIKEKEIKKPIGYSSVELESGHQKFGVNDETHPFTTQIFETLLSLDRIMGKEASIHWDSILVENSVC